ncbi:josephin-1-like isoform X2 [Cylas formicarius]|uniref:josephin-1-like isoform X2 n=1 Tax=Cylas formicarius TaxID=197179 RepID=UPI002958389C|nr:josephin-1-like isoform X2 [Cylas formicarius]
MSVQDLFHEKQVRQLCALHALNNLFQQNTFEKTELDSICYRLSPENWINPHKSMLGFGNYDINVIIKALESRGFEAIWFDKRKDPNCLNWTNICGFILNIPMDYKISFITLPLKRRHWIAIRSIMGQYYNLDSKLDYPELIDDLCKFIREQLKSQDKELFVIVTKEVEQNQNWILDDTN